MSQLTVQKTLEEIDAVHRELAKLTVDQILGIPLALNALDILESHPVVLRPKTLSFLRKTLKYAETEEEIKKTHRAIFSCQDLMIEEKTASLNDMVKFYMERGWMHVDSEKIAALEVVPWLQAEYDYDRREQMKKEISIFLKGIINPMLLGILELTTRAVVNEFGYKNYKEYCEAKKQISFDEKASIFRTYLAATRDMYFRRMRPWVEAEIGKPFENLSRYHALFLLRIKEYDEIFPVSRLREIIGKTFAGLGFDPYSRPDIVINASESPRKSPDGICIGVNIPGEIYVLTKPVGGLIDVETLLHEVGHAFFLGHFDPDLPVEDRRLLSSTALDETFAFLFANLLENPAWLSKVANLPQNRIETLIGLQKTKRLCLIRRYIGKFLAEKELHEGGDIKNSEPYCRHLGEATGFVYEPQGYLVDMDQGFYSIDYLMAWSGANVLSNFLEARYGTEWFSNADAGDFLRLIAQGGRRESLDKVLLRFCDECAALPSFE